MLEIGNITFSEKQAIEEFKRRIEHDLTPRLLEDDTLYYRFLKARDFNLKNAETLLRKHLSDREYFGTETILEDYKTPEHLAEYFAVSFLGFDKDGSVVRYVDVGGADHKGVVSSWDFKQMVMFNLHYMEGDILQLREQSKKLGRPLSKFVFIMNMDKMNLFKATFKKGIDMMLKGFALYQDNYPERIKSVYVINASVYFNIAFAIVKTCLASALLQKIRIYGRDEWKEDLLEIIDADVLPAFLGGNRTDPDGNPLCNSFIVHGKAVPEELYAKNYKKSLSKEENVKKLTITRFSCSEIMFYVCEPNSHIEWEFETKTKDIGFGLYYKDSSIENPKIEELIKKQRIDTMLGAETGVYKCKKVGTYIIVFDNTYSWIYSKEIYYRIHLRKPKECEYQTV